MSLKYINDIPGFPSLDAGSGTTGTDFQNSKKGAKKSSKSGAFQSMGLSAELLRGIQKRGYKLPTPIQRKTIPLILEGRDVVAMAKTGSGKTACFLIPLFEKLKKRDRTKGARALILSPTRELAQQTLTFIKFLGQYLDLKAVSILGGDSMDSQFSAVHTNPDIIVATPGRFLHLCTEMDLDLKSIEYVVFDEADQLFEMGFGQQLTETLYRLPSNRQTVLFSATLPKQLADFAKAGLSDPVLLRLDVDSKLPETLALKFIYCRTDERYTALVALLKYVIPRSAQTVVFAATQYHVELVSHMLTEVGITNTLLYPKLDPAARKINTAQFVAKKVSVLIVTDLVARGIDIPSLDFVVNLHFPGKPKLFVHRVGRCARAGRTGTAYSIFTTEDLGHVLDLHLFLGRSFESNNNNIAGVIPQELLEEEHLTVTSAKNGHNIAGVLRASENAYKKYLSTRPVASVAANARAKKINLVAMKPLEDLLNASAQLGTAGCPDQATRAQQLEAERKLQEERQNLLLALRNKRTKSTIFELKNAQKSAEFLVMKNKRAQHSAIIEKYREQRADEEKLEADIAAEKLQRPKRSQDIDEDELNSAFTEIVAPKRCENTDSLYKDRHPKAKKRRLETKQTKDEQFYIPYQSSDKATEDGLAVNTFEGQAKNAEFSVYDRTTNETQFKPGQKKWDRKKKKMVAVQDPRAGKIRTESGAWIPASFKTGRYAEWKQKSKIEEQLQQEDDGFELQSHEQRYPASRAARHNAKVALKKRLASTSKEGGLRNPDQIVKQRMRLELIKKRNADNTLRKAENRKRSMRKTQHSKAAGGGKPRGGAPQRNGGSKAGKSGKRRK